MLPHPFTNFEIQQYYQYYQYNNIIKFNDVYSRDNVPNKIKDVSYVTNLDKYANIGTHWIALYANRTYFDSFGVGHILKFKNLLATETS